MSRVSLLLFAVACTGAEQSPDPTQKPEPSTPTEAGPAWYGEVEPVVREHCVGCHQADGIGAFALDDYETAKTWSSAMASAVTARTMPPWLVVDDGSCGDFADSRWMSDEDIALLSAWAEAGAPEGDPALAISEPLPEPPALSQVDATLSTPTFVPVADGTPYAMYDEYRCFLIDQPFDGDTFLTGFEVVPGNEAIVHHVLAMPVDLQAPGWDGVLNGQHITDMDDADDRDGWDCYGTAGDNVSIKGIPVVWAPGMGAVEFPEGVGVPVSGSDAMVIQVHYNLVDPATVGQTDRTEVRLRTAEQVDRVAWLSLPDAFLNSLFYGNPEVIPPGEPAYTYTSTYLGSDILAMAGVPYEQWGQPFDLVSVMPHMHGLGRRETMTLIRAGSEQAECLADVPSWDFEWQLTYFYEEPVTLSADDQLEVSCTWDTSALTEPTFPGWGTSNEMCLVTLMVIPDSARR
jgi:hypothetical protein